MQDERDDRIARAIDSTLDALRQAAPPAGLESRIEHRLQQHQRAATLRPNWRDVLRGSTVAGGWLRGAVSGACVAGVLAIAFFSIHHTKAAPQPSPAVGANSGYAQSFPKLVVEQQSRPCTPPVLQAAAPPTPHPTQIARGGLAENHRQPLELPLTEQERGLVRLVHLAGPQQLAGMTSEAKANANAQEAAAFDKFFTPPAPPAETSEAVPAEAPAGASAPRNQDSEPQPNHAAPQQQPQNAPQTERGIP